MSTPASTPSQEPIILDLSALYGPVAVGTLLSWVFWGISCMQLFIYYTTYDNDRCYLRFLVLFLWALQTAAEVMNLIPLFAFISKFGDFAHFRAVPSLFFYAPIPTTLQISIIQLYFFHRIYVFSGRKKFFLLIGILLSLWQFVTTTVYSSIVLQNAKSQVQIATNPVIQNLWISIRGCSAAADTIIAVSMTYFLRKKSFSYEIRSNALSARIFVMIVNTGIWTAGVAILSFCLRVGSPNSNLFVLIELPLGIIYFNTFLANLNARDYLRSKRSERALSTGNLPSSFTFGIPRDTTQSASENETTVGGIP